MTDEEFWIANIKDIVEWADNIAGEWNGDEAGKGEDRANLANEIIHKATELEGLISDMEEL